MKFQMYGRNSSGARSFKIVSTVIFLAGFIIWPVGTFAQATVWTGQQQAQTINNANTQAAVERAKTVGLGLSCGDLDSVIGAPCSLDNNEAYTKGRARCVKEDQGIFCRCLECEKYQPQAAPSEPALDIKPPVLGLPIPDLTFTNVTVTQQGEKKFIDVPFLAEYIAAVYKYAVGVAAVIAAVMMMLGGFQYLTAGGDASKVSAGKERITDALIGLMMALGTYVVLNAINPDLLALNALRLQVVKRIEFTPEESNDPGDIATSGEAVCHTVADCQKICDLPSDKQPKSGGRAIDPSQVQPIPTIPGLDGNGQKATQAAIDALTKAAATAQNDPTGKYTLKITSGFRPLEKQILIVCRDYIKQKPDRIGKDVAWPGLSNHGLGDTVDVQLWQGSVKKTCSGPSTCDQKNTATWGEMSKKLDQIMSSAGFSRYKAEIWHYGLTPEPGCSCTTNCPDIPAC